MPKPGAYMAQVIQEIDRGGVITSQFINKQINININNSFNNSFR